MICGTVKNERSNGCQKIKTLKISSRFYELCIKLEIAERLVCFRWVHLQSCDDTKFAKDRNSKTFSFSDSEVGKFVIDTD